MGFFAPAAYAQNDNNSASISVILSVLQLICGTPHYGGQPSIQTQYIYQPFGSTLLSGTANSNPFQFTGRQQMAGGGIFENLYYMRGRYYSPTYRRFISPDPIGFAGGDPNLYAYVHNDPVDFTDRFGLQGGISGAFGGGMSTAQAISALATESAITAAALGYGDASAFSDEGSDLGGASGHAFGMGSGFPSGGYTASFGEIGAIVGGSVFMAGVVGPVGEIGGGQVTGAGLIGGGVGGGVALVQARRSAPGGPSLPNGPATTNPCATPSGAALLTGITVAEIAAHGLMGGLAGARVGTWVGQPELGAGLGVLFGLNIGAYHAIRDYRQLCQ